MNELEELVAQLRTVGNDTQNVEVKEAAKLPKSICETISAFANGSGGIIILGLSERDGFKPVPGFNARALADSLAQVCANHLEPPVRADISIESCAGANVVVGIVPELAPVEKPCYVKTRGRYAGSYIRTGDGDRRLSSYEVDRLLEQHTQPRFDCEPVPEAERADLDSELVSGLLEEERRKHPRVFAQLEDEESLRKLGALTKTENGNLVPTLGGLMALGTYPQQYFPRLNVAFTRYPGLTKQPEQEGLKFLDSSTLVGPIPSLLQDTLELVAKNMQVAGVLVGGLRREIPDYPLDAVREAVANALMHRDYSPGARGTQVQVNMYADRLEICSPGGLYGTVTVDALGEASSTRNARLSALLESTPFTGGMVVENRGTGFQLIEQRLRDNGMPAPEVTDTLSEFKLVLRKRVLEGEAKVFAGGDGNVRGRLAAGAESERARLREAEKALRQREAVALTAGKKAAGKPKRAGKNASADKVLTFLADCPQGATLSQLVQATGMGRSTLWYSLDKQVRAGTVAVEGAGDGVRRSRKAVYKLGAGLGGDGFLSAER